MAVYLDTSLHALRALLRVFVLPATAFVIFSAGACADRKRVGRRARRLLQSKSYREADVGEERCIRVAIDPRAPAAQRIGSAAALSHASEDVRARVRIAIDETADPIVANALEDALDGRAVGRALRTAITAR
jgi:hypothetical protein